MATASQTVAALDAALRTRGAGAKYFRAPLVGAGILPNSQGLARDQEPEDIVLLILAMMIGGAAVSRPQTASQYGYLEAADGRALIAELSECLRHPDRMLELRVSTGVTAAFVRKKRADGHVEDLDFRGDGHTPGGQIERFAVISSGTWTGLCATLANPPEPRKRRRRRKPNHA